MVRRAVHTRSIRAAVRSLVERLEDRQLLSSGQLVPSYGNGGAIVLPDNIVDWGEVFAVSLDNSVFAALNNQVTKLTPAGQPDSTFGVGGVVTLPVATTRHITGLDVQPDGKVLLTLRDDPTVAADNPSTDARVMRLMPNGQPDSTWGTSQFNPTQGDRGIVTFDFSLLSQVTIGSNPFDTDVISRADSVLVQPDGKVLVGGYDMDLGAANPSAALARFNSDGSPDLTFGVSGAVLLSSPATYIDNDVTNIRLQADGQIAALTAGDFDDGSGNTVTNFVLYRCAADGTVDGTFGGGNGMVEGPTDGFSSLYPFALEIDSLGRFDIVANQQAGLGGPAPTLVGGFLLRYANDGTQDTLFGAAGSNGFVTVPAAISPQGISTLAIASDDSIIVGVRDSFRIAGFTSAGVLDPNIPTTIYVSPPTDQTTFVDRVLFDHSGALFAVGGISNTLEPAGQTARIAAARFGGEFDNPPVVTLTGPTTVAEDQPITFTYAPRLYGNHTVIGYQWDFDYNGTTFVTDFNGPDPVIPVGQWFAPLAPFAPHKVALRIIDDTGRLSAVSVLNVAVTNVAPVASISLAGPRVIQNVPTTLDLSVDYLKNPLEAAGNWSIDWGDGTPPVITASLAPALHTYLAAGPFTIQASFTDFLGALSAVQTLNVTVLPFPQIAGFVFSDANYDGVQTSGEAGIAGVQVFLDANNNGVLNGGETVTTTDADGYYQFAGQVAAPYHVAIVKPAPLFFTIPGNGRTDVTVANVNATVSTNFGLADYYVATGTVFADNNNNGVQDPGEGDIANATIYADTNNNGVLDPNEVSTVSSINEVQTLTPANLPTAGTYSLTFGAGTTIALNWNASPATVQTELRKLPGLQDIVVGGSGLNAGAMTFTIPASAAVGALTIDSSALTPAVGYAFARRNFSLLPVRPANTVIRAILPSGFTLTSNTTGTTTLPALFGALGRAAVVGGVFLDLDSNATRALNEPGVAGVTVYVDINNNSVQDAGDIVATSDAAGMFSLANVPPGTWNVRAVAPAGYHFVNPSASAISVTRSLNVPVRGLSYPLLRNNSVSGVVYNDANADAARGSAEKPLANVMVFLDSNGNGQLDAGELTTVTNSAGGYNFSNVTIVQGERIGIAAPSGYRLTTDLSHALPTVAGQSIVQDIGLTPRISVSGGVFSDLNRDKVWQLKEAGLAGFRVYIDSNKNGVFDAGRETSVLTDSLGRYTFNNLLPGTYVIRVVPKANWQTTTPLPVTKGSGQFTLTVKAGQVVDKRNFGFFKIPTPIK